MSPPPLFTHQRTIADFILENEQALVFSDPGTGKTAAVLTAINERPTVGDMRALVLCPKSIMVPAWLRDAQTFTPDLSVGIAAAPASNRQAVLDSPCDVVILNHDGVKWLADNPEYLDDFDFLAIDESTAFKHPTSARSKALAKICGEFMYRVAMTGTPIANNLIDIWHQVYVVDDGAHLGARYYAFRSATHDPEPVTPTIQKWVPKDGAFEVVADLIADISLRFKLEDCIDMPPHRVSHRLVDLTPKVRKAYNTMLQNSLVAITEGRVVTAVHAAAQATKLEQIASGSLYDEDHDPYTLAPDRYDLVAQLVGERLDPCVVAFRWKHQREGLIQALERAGIDNYAVLDGDNNRDVDATVQAYQAGELRCILAHPKTAGHGLTLTRGRTTIWSSPLADAELYDQLNRRIYRAGQGQSTETIIVGARGTIDEQRIEQLTGRLEDQGTTLDLIKALSPVE